MKSEGGGSAWDRNEGRTGKDLHSLPLRPSSGASGRNRPAFVRSNRISQEGSPWANPQLDRSAEVGSTRDARRAGR